MLLPLFLGATFLASITPGPVVLLTIAVALRSGVSAALRAILGICTGSLIYLAVAFAGLLAVLVAHHVAFHAVQVAGACYLVYLGLRMASGGVVTLGATRIDGAAHERSYVDGLVTQLSNPKAILYWTALLPSFLDPARPIRAQLLLLLSIGISVDFVVLGAYALGAAAVRRWMRDPRHGRRLNLIAGALFAVTGAALMIASVRAFV